MKRSDPIVDGWGAYWIDDLVCNFCSRTWAEIDGADLMPDQRQYVTLNIEPREQENTLDPAGIHLCPECAEELAYGIIDLHAADIPMGMQPEDTDTMCALPNDFYLYRTREYFEGLWFDDDDGVLRDAEGKRVPGKQSSYSFARKQRQAPRGSIRKEWR